MLDNLSFEPGYYRVTRLVGPNVIEIDDTWFVRLKGVDNDTKPEELKKWLREGYIVRVIPYRRDGAAYIISDVWLGNAHINRQFSNYEIDNFVQAFEEWQKNRNGHFLENKNELEDLISAFHIAKPVIRDKKLKISFENWLEVPSYKTGEIDPALSISQSVAERENLLKAMVENFNQWKSKIKPEVTV